MRPPVSSWARRVGFFSAVAAVVFFGGGSMAQPGPKGSLPLAVPPVAVAAELKTKGEASQVGPDAVLFDGPRGDGRSGAKGVLLRSEALASASAKAGSTWAFRYTWAGSSQGVQMIHPTGRGQAVAVLLKDYIGLSTPGAWREVGYSGGDGKRVRETTAYKKIFPLKEGEEYTVVSRLSPGGAYELFVNGQLVGTGRASSASPLDLQTPEGSVKGGGRGKLEFKAAGGAELPLKWEAGWAGLILGPMDNGQNVVRDLRYYPTVAELPEAPRR